MTRTTMALRGGGLAALLLMGASAWGQDAPPVTKDYLIDEYGERRAFSRAVATAGGTTVRVAGHTTRTDAGREKKGPPAGSSQEKRRPMARRLSAP